MNSSFTRFFPTIARFLLGVPLLVFGLNAFFNFIPQPETPLPAAAALAGVSHLLREHPFDLPFVLRKRLTFSAVAHVRQYQNSLAHNILAPGSGIDELKSIDVITLPAHGLIFTSANSEVSYYLNKKTMK